MKLLGSKEKIEKLKMSSKSFTFGKTPVRSEEAVRLPIRIGVQAIYLLFYVVDLDIPALLSCSSMRKLGCILDFSCGSLFATDIGQRTDLGFWGGAPGEAPYLQNI